MKLSLEIRTHEDVTVVYCQGRIAYGEEAATLSVKVAELLARTRYLVLELSGVEMIDSAGLGELVVLFMWSQAAGCCLKLAAAPRHIRELLELTNLTSVLEIHPTLEGAVAPASRRQPQG